MNELITCTAFHGGLEARHSVNTCLSRIAMNRANGEIPFPECDSCSQAKGFMAKYPSVIAGKAAAYKKKLVSNQKIGINAQFLKTEDEKIRQKSYRESEMIGGLQVGINKISGVMYPADNKQNHIIETPPEPTISAPLCIKCGKEPQVPRMRKGKSSWASYCRECKRQWDRERKDAVNNYPVPELIIRFDGRRGLYNEICRTAKLNERTVMGEIFYRLRVGK